MPIYGKGPLSDFTPAPKGSHAAVVCDVVDLGTVTSSWQGNTRSYEAIQVRWLLGKNDPKSGQAYMVMGRYKNSLHKKAKLRALLETIFGRDLTKEELAPQGLDLEAALIGQGCLLNIVHNTKEGTTYANVSAVVALPDGMSTPVVNGYVRVCDRDDKHTETARAAGWEAAEPPPADDDIPF